MSWQHFAYIFQNTRLNIFNALLKNKSQTSYFVTEKIVLKEYVERVEQFKNTGYNGKCMWNSLTLLPAQSLHSPSLFQQLQRGEWQDMLHAHNKMLWLLKLVLLSPHLRSLGFDLDCCVSHETPKWQPGAILPLIYAGKWWIFSLKILRAWRVHYHRQLLQEYLKTLATFALFLNPFIVHVVHWRNLISGSLSYLCF